MISNKDCKAQNEDFLKLIFENKEKYPNDFLPYRLLLPRNYNKDEKYPLVTILHGVGERGIDNEKQLSFMNNVMHITKNEYLEKYPCFILIPQCPEPHRWVESEWAYGNYSQDNLEISVPSDLLIQLINSLIKEYSVDESRLYITGLSMGGFGTWGMIMRFPGKFAAALPICGGADLSKAPLLKNTPIFTFHGNADEIIPVTATREMTDAIKKAGSTCINYIEYEGVGHNSWDIAYKNEELYSWMFSQKLPCE